MNTAARLAKGRSGGLTPSSPIKPANPLAGYGTPDTILAMQRLVGNRVTSDLLGYALGSEAERQANPSAGTSILPSNIPPAVREAVSSPGKTLDTETRAFMESRFGNDFAHVRVHTGDKAAASARSVGASAYALGSEIVFGAGRYVPQTKGGRRLIAHELAHVVQQRRPGVPRTGHESLLEHDASQAASRVIGGSAPVRVERASALRVSRETSSDDDKYCRLTKSKPGPTQTKVDAAIELFRRAGLHALKHPPENDQATRLLEGVEAYFRGIITPQNVDRLFTGASKTHLSILTDGGLDAVQSMIRGIRSGSSTMCGLWDRKFDQLLIARQPLLILSGEAGAKTASLPGAVNEAFQTTLIIAGTITAVLISGGAIAAAAEAAGGVIASETAAQLIAGSRIGTLVISNPAVAEQIFLFGAGTVIEIIAAGGIKEYLRQLSTPEGAANKAFEILHLRLTMGGGGSGRNRTVEVPVEEVPTPPAAAPPTKIRIRLKEAPSRSTTPATGRSTGGQAGTVDEPRGSETAPAPNKKTPLNPKAAAQKTDPAERQPSGPADKRSQMKVAEIDEKIEATKREQIDKREVAEDFLDDTLRGGASRRAGGGVRQRRLDEPLSTGKITEDLDRLIAAGKRPDATPAEKANSAKAEDIKRGFEENARKLNDLARQRRGAEKESR